MTHTTFTLVHTNYVGTCQRVYAVKLDEHLDEEIRREILKNRPNQLNSFEEAKSTIESNLNARKKHLLAELEQVDYNLRNLDYLYPDVMRLEVFVQENFDELVKRFKELKAQPGTFKFESLRVSNSYMHAAAELFVLLLDESGAVIQTFSTTLRDLILEAMSKAGLVYSTDWNGVGHSTWSIQVNSVSEDAA